MTGSKDEQDSIMSDYGKVQEQHLKDVITDLNTMRDATQAEFKLKPA